MATIVPLAGARFGAEVLGLSATDPSTWPSRDELTSAWYDAGGLLIFRDLAPDPAALVQLSALFGTVEDMVETRTAPNLINQDQTEIFLVHGADFSRKPPASPAAGNSALQFPARKGYHSDQSFRRPPPDASLLYCVTPALPNQGQTLFADATAAFDALSPVSIYCIYHVPLKALAPRTGQFSLCQSLSGGASSRAVLTLLFLAAGCWLAGRGG